MFPLECLTPTQCYVLILPDEPTDDMIVFLHGLGDKAQNFARTSIVSTVRQAMKSGEIDPAIILIPDGDRGYWMDWIDGTHLYETWTLDTIEATAEHYDVSNMSVVGVSMGGYAALSIGLRHPELFHSIVAYSPTDLEIALQKSPFLPVYHNMFGADIYREYAYAMNPRELILRGAGRHQSIYWIVGDQEQDKFWQGSHRLETAMVAQGLEPNIHVVTGGDHSFQNTWTVASTKWWIEQWQLGESR